MSAQTDAEQPEADLPAMLDQAIEQVVTLQSSLRAGASGMPVEIWHEFIEIRLLLKKTQFHLERIRAWTKQP